MHCGSVPLGAAHCRESVDVEKRVLIQGQGALGEARLDQRANSPAFRLRRWVYIVARGTWQWDIPSGIYQQGSAS